MENFKKEHLLSKSKEAFLLSIEIFNKPTIDYKIEAFSFLIINAWELLLKYKIINDEGYEAIYYKDNDRTLSIEDCLKKTFSNPNDKIRVNIETIVVELRNNATHLIIPEFNIILEPLFQSCVYNYLNYLTNTIKDNEFKNMKFNPIIMHSNIYNPKHIQNTYGDAPLAAFNSTIDIIINLQDRFAKDDDSNKILLPIKHSLAFTKNENKADFRAYYETSGIAIKEIAVPKDINTNYPYGYKELSLKLKIDYPNLKFNTNILTEIRIKHNIENRPEFYYYVKKNGARIYSESFYIFLVKELKKSQPQDN